MRHNKFFSPVIALCMIAFFTMSSVPSQSAPKKTAVTITALFDFEASPNFFTGTFSTSGALTISGDATMDVDFNANFITGHCVVTLIPIPKDGGTITIHQECQFATTPAKGRWQIVSGTGAYANLKGNGSLLMPDDITEAMTGVIY